MKKLLLLPLLLMSMLVGCNENSKSEKETETIYTPLDWFEDTDVIENELKVDIDYYEVNDYEKVIGERMMRFFKIEFKFPKKIDEVEYDSLMRYKIKKNMGPYTDLTIYFHEKCIETIAYGRINNKEFRQFASYNTYGASSVASLISFASIRGEKIQSIQKEEQDAAKEACTLENFYKQIEESATNPTATFSNKSKEDVNHALLDDFKDLLSSKNEKSYYKGDNDYFMSYGLNENFMLKFYLDYEQEPVAILEYKYQSSLNYTSSVECGYRVSRDKVDNIIKKITGVAN